MNEAQDNTPDLNADEYMNEAETLCARAIRRVGYSVLQHCHGLVDRETPPDLRELKDALVLVDGLLTVIDKARGGSDG